MFLLTALPFIREVNTEVAHMPLDPAILKCFMFTVTSRQVRPARGKWAMDGPHYAVPTASKAKPVTFVLNRHTVKHR